MTHQMKGIDHLILEGRIISTKMKMGLSVK